MPAKSSFCIRFFFGRICQGLEIFTVKNDALWDKSIFRMACAASKIVCLVFGVTVGGNPQIVRPPEKICGRVFPSRRKALRFGKIPETGTLRCPGFLFPDYCSISLFRHSPSICDMFRSQYLPALFLPVRQGNVWQMNRPACRLHPGREDIFLLLLLSLHFWLLHCLYYSDEVTRILGSAAASLLTHLIGTIC